MKYVINCTCTYYMTYQSNDPTLFCLQPGSFSSDWTSSEECSLCRNPVCQPTMSLTQTCNSTVDNKCGCLDPHRFHHIATDSCRDCVGCSSGHYPLKPCTGETICVPCPDVSFRNSLIPIIYFYCRSVNVISDYTVTAPAVQ